MVRLSAVNGHRPTRTVQSTSTALVLGPAGQAQWTKTPSVEIPSSRHPVPAANNAPVMQQMQTHHNTQILTRNGSGYMLKPRFLPLKRAGVGFTGPGTASLLPSGVGRREWQQVYYLPKHMNRSSNVVTIFLILVICRRIISLFLDLLTNVFGFWIFGGFIAGAKGHACIMCIIYAIFISLVFLHWMYI